ncbi:type II CAAX endopeptidase family protein [Clostridiisalibacter paucivorans]|uniref:type II CAAX endopeptidase family protein n=1 Tax=Clostridiisalibacter paucivorans TaxID=408753 RepID=UPI000684E8E8|nr:type II CAAX endopeptidase family protein [Clostridiisalibacter paucivorans]
MDRKKIVPSIFEANIFYLIIALLLLTLGAMAQQREFYTGILITEYIIILLPTVLYLKIKGYSLKKVLRLNKLNLKQIILIPLLVIFSYPIGAFLNILMAIILSRFGQILPPPLPVPSTNIEVLLGVFVVAITPGICEEVMFRGLIMRSYERKGTIKAILISGFLFGIFHFNIQNLMGPMFLGILFGFIVHKTNSLYAVIIAHLSNNLFAWILSYLFGSSQIQQEANSEAANMIPYTLQLMIGASFFLFIAIIAGMIARYIYKKLPAGQQDYFGEEIRHLTEEGNTVFNIIPIVVVMGIFIYKVVEYIRYISSIS